MVRPDRRPLPGRTGLFIAAGLVVILGAAAVFLLLVGGLATGGPSGSTAEYSVEYWTESGNTTNQGFPKAPLTVLLHLPRVDNVTYVEPASIGIEILDSNGQPATFGGSLQGPFRMQPTQHPALWEYTGSMPERPGDYYARFHVYRLDDATPEIPVELLDPKLTVTAESGPPLASGFVIPNDSNLWLVPTDGRRQRRVTFFRPPDESADKPAWSPDGKTIAFAYSPKPASNEVPATDIWLVSPDGSNLRMATAHGKEENLSDPAWSGDGKTIYFGVDTIVDSPKADPAQNRRIDRVSLDSGARTVAALGAQMPSSSAFGNGLVYLEDAPAPDKGGSPGQRLVIMAEDGSNKKILVDSGVFNRMYASHISPDGKWVVFAAVNPPLPASGNVDVLGWLLFRPTIAYAHGQPWDLYLVSTSGGAPARLTNLNRDQPYPVWLGDSALAFSDVTGISRLKLTSAGSPDGQPESILGAPGNTYLASPNIVHGGIAWHGP